MKGFAMLGIGKVGWIEKVKPVQEEYVDKMNQSGMNGSEILDTVKKLATEFNQQYQ